MDVELLERAGAQANICSVFGNPRRILILWALAEQELSVGRLAEVIDATIQNTSQHLRVMKDKGLLATRREGSTIYYHLVHSELLETCGLLAVKPLQVVKGEKS